MKRFLPLFLCFVLLGAVSNAQEAAPQTLRVAFWDLSGGLAAPNDQNPTKTPVLAIDSERQTRVMNWIRAKGDTAKTLRADQFLSDDFSRKNYDILILPGDALPRFSIAPVKKWVENGGILIALRVQNAPWSVSLTPDVNGRWTLAPNEKNSSALPDLFALSTDATQNAGASIHRIAPDFADFLAPPALETQGEFPEANPPLAREFLDAPALKWGKMALVTPLISSNDGENEEFAGTPQIVAVQNGKNRAILVFDAIWSDEPDATRFARQSELWSGLMNWIRVWK